MAKRDYCAVCGAPLSMALQIRLKDAKICHDCYEKAGYGFMSAPARIEIAEVRRRIGIEEDIEEAPAEKQD